MEARPRPPVPPLARLASALVAAVIALAGCGGGDPSREAVVLAYPGAPDSLDPAVAVSQQAWNALWRVYTPPLTYDDGDATRLVGGVAEALPEVSADGRTYRLTIRRDARFSDGTPVRPSDVEHTLVRVLRMGSPGAPLFLGIGGAQAVLEKRATDISGVDADDAAGTVTFRLTRADATFPYALATSYAGVVPASTPASDRSASPPAGAGAYRIDVTRVSRGFTLRPVGDDGTRQPISVRYLTRPEAQVGAVRDGTVDVVQQPTPGDALNELRRAHPERYASAAGLSTSMFFLNVRTPPFDDVRVRRATALAVDPDAVVRLYGGVLQEGCGLLPPAVAPAGDGCPPGPRDLARARRLVREARAADVRVKVWGPAEGPDGLAATYLAEVLSSIGLDARPATVAAAAYFGAISAPATRAQAGVLSWGLDYPHPAGMLRLVDGDELGAASTVDVSNVRDPVITRGIDALAARPLTPSATAAYGALADRAVTQGYVIPYGHGRIAAVRADRVDPDCLRINPILGPDLARICTD